MIDTKAAYKRQLETNVCVTLSMLHLSAFDIDYLTDLDFKRGSSESIAVIQNDEFQTMVKISEDKAPNDIRLSQPVRDMLCNFYVAGIRLVIFDVDAEVMKGLPVSESRLDPDREILPYMGNGSAVIDKIRANEMVMLIPDDAIDESINRVSQLTQNYTEFDPVTAFNILELNLKCGKSTYFA